LAAQLVLAAMAAGVMVALARQALTELQEQPTQAAAAVRLMALELVVLAVQALLLFAIRILILQLQPLLDHQR
jgi:hypothetical protein